MVVKYSNSFSFAARCLYKRGFRRAVSVTFVYCVETTKDMAVVAMECE